MQKALDPLSVPANGQDGCSDLAILRHIFFVGRIQHEFNFSIMECTYLFVMKIVSYSPLLDKEVPFHLIPVAELLLKLPSECH